jgi:uncharacterized protein (TIGR02118 family)
MTTLLALIRRPGGGDDTLATLERAYAETHLPLIGAVPGLRELHVRRVRRRLMGDDDFAIATAMTFDDWDATRVALGSEAMAAAGRNLEEIAPGLTTLLVLDDATDLTPDGFR